MRLHPVLAIAGVVNKELYRRKDFYVLFFLTGLVTLVAGSASFFEERQVVRYVKEICLLLIWVAGFVIAITMAARQIPAERENRTIFPLLAKPVTRAEVVVGKFVGCWCATGLALLCFYIFFTLISASREGDWMLTTSVQAFLSHWVMLAVVIALTLLCSLLFSAPSSTATFCFIIAFAILLLGRHLGKIALQVSEPVRTLLYGIYFTIPQLSFFDIRQLVIHNHPAVDWGVWMLAAVYGAFYTALFLVAACVAVNRKTLN